MPSPFPGMDPFLENPVHWASLHHMLISKSLEALQPPLRERGYYVNIDERVWLTAPQRPVYPDLAVFQGRSERVPKATNVAVLDVDEPIRLQGIDVEVHESFLEIFDAVGNRLITGIEFLSPSNKSDPTGRNLFQRKQAELWAAGVHRVEIDLHRSGGHVLSAPLSSLNSLKPWDYVVNISRANHTYFDVYPIRLRGRLPKIRIPLKEGDEDAVLDLQAVFNQAYDTGPYPDRVDYRSPPVPPLSPADAEWADQLLQAAGLRTV